MAIAVIGPLAVIFALWGAYGVVSMSFGAPDYGLKVNDERISIETLNRAWQQRQAQYQQTLNGVEMSDAQKTILQQQLVDEYVRQTLLRQRAQQSGYRATDAQVKAAVTGEPAFQLDGKYDPRVARNMLAQIGMTEEGFFAERREALQIGPIERSDRAVGFHDACRTRSHLCARERAARAALRAAGCRSLSGGGQARRRQDQVLV